MSIQDHFSAEAETAEEAAREAGSILMAFFGKSYRVEEKGKGNPVTTADLEANVKIRETILGCFPKDGWLSEEDKDSPERLTAVRVWVVDPMDGTKEFIQGVPQFSVSIALVVDGRPVVGVVYNPCEGKLFRAVAERGATLNDRPVRISARDDLQGALLLISRSEPRRKFQPFAELCRLEPVGSIAYRLALVAAGQGDGTLTLRSIRDWDVCAGELIVREAGGIVSDGSGQSLVFNQRDTLHRGIVASNRILSRRLQGILAGILAERR